MLNFEKEFESAKNTLNDILSDSVTPDFKKDIFNDLYRYKYACGNPAELLKLKSNFCYLFLTAFKMGIVNEEQKNKCLVVVRDFGCNCL